MLDETGRRKLEVAYRQVAADLWRAVFVYAGGIREVADEAVAEAFTQAGRRLAEIGNLRPWLYRAAFRIAAGELKRRAAHRGLEDADSDRGESSINEGEAELIDLTTRLSTTQRSVFVLRHVFGYSGRETARLLGISEIAVRVHLHAARRRLRELVWEADAR